MSDKKCSCGCCSGASAARKYEVPVDDGVTLADLPVGAKGTVKRIMPTLRGRKKFADVGVVTGAELKVEGRAPFGGLLRVRVMESSMALHSEDASRIVMSGEGI